MAFRCAAAGSGRPPRFNVAADIRATMGCRLARLWLAALLVYNGWFGLGCRLFALAAKRSAHSVYQSSKHFSSAFLLPDTPRPYTVWATKYTATYLPASPPYKPRPAVYSSGEGTVA